MIAAIEEPHAVEQLARAVDVIDASEVERQEHVLLRGQRRDELGRN